MKFNFNLKERNVYSYSEYRNKVDVLVSNNMTTGENHSESMLDYTNINITRMNRLDKTAKLSEEIITKISVLKPQTWLVISEAWCGDAAQNLPWLNRMAELNPNIELKIVLRDENLDIIDEYLTNNGRGIPKLVAIDSDNDIMFTWGPRPKDIQTEFLDLRNNGLEKSEITKTIQTLYARDKGISIQKDFIEVLDQLILVKA